MDPAVQNLVDSAGLVFPEIILVAGACLLFLGAAFHNRRNFWDALALAFLIGAAGGWWLMSDIRVGALTTSPFRHDYLTWFVKGIGLGAGFVFVLFSWNQVEDRRSGEYFGCLLLMIAGANLVAAANELVTLFLALELVSIPTYVLLALPKYDAPAQEAATKYFLLSIFSSALLLYGFSLLYGSAGSTNLEAIRLAIREAGAMPMPAVLVIALVMVAAGLGFRITAFPFHFYAPDVYQGAPTVGAALLALIPKVIGFVALFRVITATMLVEGGTARAWPLDQQATVLLWILALFTMFWGNLLALLQDNLKRLLAYSSVAHAGYLLVGLGAARAADVRLNELEGPAFAIFFYLIVYGAMTVGAFAVLAYLSSQDRSVETVDDLAGLSRSHPFTALMMTVLLFSLIGLPPAAGFWAKLYLFFAAWSVEGLLFKLLAVFMAINAAIGGWYYLRIVAVMYLRQPVKPLPRSREVPALAAVVICTIVTIGLFLAPGLLWRTGRPGTPTPIASPQSTP